MGADCCSHFFVCVWQKCLTFWKNCDRVLEDEEKIVEIGGVGYVNVAREYIFDADKDRRL